MARRSRLNAFPAPTAANIAPASTPFDEKRMIWSDVEAIPTHGIDCKALRAVPSHDAVTTSISESRVVRRLFIAFAAGQIL